MLGARDRKGFSRDKVDVESLEQENDRGLDHLADRVALLKNVTQGINKEANDQHKLLDNMDGSFMSVRGFMGAVTDKSRLVYNDKANKRLIYGVISVAAVLFLVWYLMRK
ncbi:Qc-SNARE, Bet1/mBET1 family [Volvox carteri f. nagariensis]|uniref:Qc-SNARE, Bet1/mBET1 family n=1 Tax=Volvox carteri f. nagariensis TaxID=3068 RepID=D8TV64_VOLCA|nr:Qc-SNARE, Bet1/mBET1 family [Volvox carteri f. nagariensis]EFJ48523.1 Qc-SNARE, Bet1/mBET1 family [Volvox carteri f. nagariensis]|eukprot:XP_002950322.1 Qc-SNARE, Bet1/mBET1 family [Volvox carteri f. nagariensis]